MSKLNICVIGTGYVGLVTGTGLAEIGHSVICCDINKEKIDNLKNLIVPIYEQGLSEIFEKNVFAKRLSFSSNIEKSIRLSDIIFIAVGTPEKKSGEADISAVKSVAKLIKHNLNKYKVICVKSTVPLNTYNEINKIINNRNNRNKFDLVSNPEFLREGSSVKDFFWPDRIVIGTDSEKAFTIMENIYRPLYRRELPIVRCNIPTAIIIKYASNSFLAVKVSFINEIASLCDTVNANISDVSKALGMDGRISPKFLHPGPGYGGSCFPKDTKALVQMSKKNKANMKIVEAAIKSNKIQKRNVIQKLSNLLKDKYKNKNIAIFGLAFKAQTDDIRESSSIDLLKFLKNKNCNITAYDPEASENMKKFFPKVNYCDSWREAAINADCIVIMTEWSEFRSIDIKELSTLVRKKIILDTRNIMNVSNLEKYKFSYDTIGAGKRIN